MFRIIYLISIALTFRYFPRLRQGNDTIETQMPLRFPRLFQFTETHVSVTSSSIVS